MGGCMGNICIEGQIQRVSFLDHVDPFLDHKGAARGCCFFPFPLRSLWCMQGHFPSPPVLPFHCLLLLLSLADSGVGGRSRAAAASLQQGCAKLAQWGWWWQIGSRSLPGPSTNILWQLGSRCREREQISMQQLHTALPVAGQDQLGKWWWWQAELPDLILHPEE